MDVQRRTFLAGALATSALIVGASSVCRPRSAAIPAPKPLAISAEGLALQRQRDAADAELRRILGQTQADIDALERKLLDEPLDTDTRRQLLTYYWYRFSDTTGRQRRDHILWFIRNDPGAALLQSPAGRLYPGTGDLADADGYVDATGLWLALPLLKEVRPAVVTNAALFFSLSRPLLSEQILSSAASRRLSGNWARQLGALYGLMLVGHRTVVTPGGLAMQVHEGHSDATRRYARQQLMVSNDGRILTAAAEVFLTQSSNAATRGELDAFVEAMLRRAVALDPRNVEARVWLAELAHHKFAHVAAGLRHNSRSGNEYSLFTQLSPRMQWDLLPEMLRASMREPRDPYAGPALRNNTATLLEQYARLFLQLHERRPMSSETNNALYYSRMAQATAAFLSGHSRKANEHLRSTLELGSSERLAYLPGISDWWVIKPLIAAGYGDSVADYFEAMSKRSVVGKTYFRESAEALRRSEQPVWYQMHDRIIAPFPIYEPSVHIEHAPH